MSGSKVFGVVWAFLAVGGVAAWAEVRLPALFTDHMVLQRGRPVPVWGWADPGEDVLVEWDGVRVRTQASVDGRWRVELPAMAARSHPGTLKVIGKNTVQVDDVLVGEVWICSGQSNMEWPMARSYEAEADLQMAIHPRLRLFTVPKRKASEPQTDVASRWVHCVPESARGFSAVAYYFGRDLQAVLGVPVGLIHTSWGGSPAEVWMSPRTLRANASYAGEVADIFKGMQENWVKNDAAFRASKEAAERSGSPFTNRPPNRPWQLSELYHGMIAPLVPYGIRGAIWYQGEANAGRAWQYRSVFTDLIQNWRAEWGQGEFPFLAVQLAPWDRNKKRSLEAITAAPGDSDWAELREAQNYAAETLRNVGVAVITDLGDKDDIHPVKKGPVGGRLALLAREIAYGEKGLVSRGPEMDRVQFSKGKAVLRFRTQGSALKVAGEALTGFSIAGADGKFVWAHAALVGKDEVVVSHPDVPKPEAVRYGWADYPVATLGNEAGLPASPFRTDAFPLTTQKKR